MEFVLAVIIIAVICLIIGVKPIYLLFAAAMLVVFLFAASLLLLTVFFVRLMFTSKHSAVFSRIDKSPRSRFKVAYYIIDGTEYPNIFPEEGFLQSKLYRGDKSCSVFLTRNKKYVYDKFACATCTIGTVACIGTAVAAFLLFINK